METTAATLLFVLHSVAANPDMAEIIYEEVVSHAGASGPISWEALHEMQYGCLCVVPLCSLQNIHIDRYIDMFLKEVLRLYPV